MFKKAEQFIQSYTWLTAVAVTGAFLFVFTGITVCLLNSGDDAFLLYTLAGGYGEPPSELLHYNHIWHPWLGALIKNLFSAFPGTNWYTLLLLIFHWFGCSAVLYVLLKRLTAAMAFFLFMILFFFIEARLLLSLNFTGAAIVAATGALQLLHFEFQQKELKSRHVVLAILFFVLAGMLRLQIAWLVLLIFLPAVIISLRKKRMIQWFVASLLFVAVLSGLNKIHQQQYIKNIPGWKQQETFRQAIFYAYNRPIRQNSLVEVFTDSMEYQLFFSGFLYDTTKFSTGKVKLISSQLTRQRWLDEKEDRHGLYWFFMELRIYILLFALMLTGLLLQKKYKALRNWLVSFFAVGAIYTYLFIFMKITTPIHLGLLLFLWICLSGQYTKKDALFPANKIYRAIMGVSILLLFGWMGLRVARESSLNEQHRQRFKCMVSEINKDRQKLFVATDDSFPLGNFYIWDLPSQYPVSNLLYKDRLLTHTWVQTLARFGITDFTRALVEDEKVFLLGRPLPALEIILRAKLSDRIPGYQCLEVRKLKPAG